MRGSKQAVILTARCGHSSLHTHINRYQLLCISGLHWESRKPTLHVMCVLLYFQDEHYWKSKLRICGAQMKQKIITVISYLLEANKTWAFNCRSLFVNCWWSRTWHIIYCLACSQPWSPSGSVNAADLKPRLVGFYDVSMKSPSCLKTILFL